MINPGRFSPRRTESTEENGTRDFPAVGSINLYFAVHGSWPAVYLFFLLRALRAAVTKIRLTFSISEATLVRIIPLQQKPIMA